MISVFAVRHSEDEARDPAPHVAAAPAKVEPAPTTSPLPAEPSPPPVDLRASVVLAGEALDAAETQKREKREQREKRREERAVDKHTDDAHVEKRPAAVDDPVAPAAGIGTLLVRPKPTSASWKVSVDHRFARETPLSLELSAGPHTLQLSSSSLKVDVTRTIDVVAGTQVRFDEDLTP